LTSKDINPNGKVITEPGVYQLAEDITFTPTRNAITQTLVTFTSSNGFGAGATGLALVSGGVVRGIDIVTPGSGYTAPPTATITGSGTGATVLSPVQFGGVINVMLIAPNFGGAGYSSLPTVTLNPPLNGAIIIPIIDTTLGGSLVGFQIADPGSGYGSTAPTISITGGGATLNATAQAYVSSGVTRALVASGGMNYTDTVVAAITIMSSNVTVLLGDHVLKQAGIDDQGNVSPTQNPFVVGIVVPDILPFQVDVAGTGVGSVQNIVLTSIGSGYTSTPNVTISAPGGSGMTATAQAIVNNGVVTAIQVLNQGSGYTSDPTVTISGGGGLTQATALANIYLLNTIGLENITISGDKGVIDGFSYRGVQIFSHTNNIEVSNLTIEHCGKLASAETSPYPGYTSNFQVSGGDALPVRSTAGLAIGETGTGTQGFQGYFGPLFFTKRIGPQNLVSNVVIDNVSCLNNYMLGSFISSTANLAMTNCHIDDTFNDNNFSVIGGWFGGDSAAEYPSVKNFIVKDCTFNRTSLIGDYKNTGLANCIGCRLTYSSGFLFEDCESNDLQNTTASTATNGGTVCNAVSDGTFRNCQFRNVSAMGLADGFHSSGSGGTVPNGHSGFDVELINCAASNIVNIGNMRRPSPVVATGDDKATGFDFFYTKNFYLQGCVASNIQYNAVFYPGKALPRNGAQGFSIQPSFIPQSNVQSVKYVNCHSSSATSSNGGSAYGFFIGNQASPVNQGLQSVLYENCTADNSLSSIPAITTGLGALGPIPQGVGLGFALFQDRTPNSMSVQLESINSFPVVYNNCKSSNNQGAPTNNPVPTLTVPVTATQYSAGFYAQGLPDTTALLGVSYYQCESIGDVYGFLLRNTKFCTIRNCRADNNVVQAGITGNVAIDGIVGEGFTDLGLALTNTPATIGSGLAGFTTSTFENNKAYNNGSNTAFFGTNANYNAFVASSITVPLFEVQVSSPSTSYKYINPSPNPSLSSFNINPNVYNISTVP